MESSVRQARKHQFLRNIYLGTHFASCHRGLEADTVLLAASTRLDVMATVLASSQNDDILDRFLQHAEAIMITGKSYRLQGQAKEGATRGKKNVSS